MVVDWGRPERSGRSVKVTAALFQPLAMRGVSVRNRIGVSPMCMYSCEDGVASEFHVAHLGARALGGAGLVIAEATGVEARGRITSACAGLYRDEHVVAWALVTRAIKLGGAVAGIQLAHAGRKAGWSSPWPTYRLLSEAEGGWTPIAPSARAFNDKYPVPQAMTRADIDGSIKAFGVAAERAVAAGFELIELHAAHGYLLSSFLSPISNHREDEFGGSFENRTRVLRMVVERVRGVIPERMPLWVRVSCTDYCDGGWTIEDSVELARLLKPLGVDAIDCSSGGNVAGVTIPTGPGYQVGFASRIRRDAGISTAAVGMITEPAQAEAIVAKGHADMVLLARASLRNPAWGIDAARALGATAPVPMQYRAGYG
jgi:2,4-dienoyl-CoA reductase-like NADH-dependent reductase (Old Yellow Enzyme family)